MAANSARQDLLGVLRRRQGLVLGARLRLRLRRADRHVARAASGPARSTSRRRSPGLNAFKNTFLALSRASKSTDEANPFPTDAVLAGPRGVVRRPRLAVRLRARPEGRQPEAEAGTWAPSRCRATSRARRCRRSSAAPTSRSRPRARTRTWPSDWIADFTANAADDGHRQGREPPEHDLAPQPRQGHARARRSPQSAKSTWFVPTAKNWTNVESSNVLRTMLTKILTGKQTVHAGGEVGERQDHLDPERRHLSRDRRTRDACRAIRFPHAAADAAGAAFGPLRRRRRFDRAARRPGGGAVRADRAGADRDRRDPRLPALLPRPALVPAVRPVRADRAQGPSGSGSTTTRRSSATAQFWHVAAAHGRSSRP